MSVVPFFSGSCCLLLLGQFDAYECNLAIKNIPQAIYRICETFSFQKYLAVKLYFVSLCNKSKVNSTYVKVHDKYLKTRHHASLLRGHTFNLFSPPQQVTEK